MNQRDSVREAEGFLCRSSYLFFYLRKKEMDGTYDEPTSSIRMQQQQQQKEQQDTKYLHKTSICKNTKHIRGYV